MLPLARSLSRLAEPSFASVLPVDVESLDRHSMAGLNPAIQRHALELHKKTWMAVSSTRLSGLAYLQIQLCFNAGSSEPCGVKKIVNGSHLEQVEAYQSGEGE